MEKRLINKWQTADAGGTNNAENWNEVMPEDKLFQEKDIRLAMEWLKEEIRERDAWKAFEIDRIVDKAFADVSKGDN